MQPTQETIVGNRGQGSILGRESSQSNLRVLSSGQGANVVVSLGASLSTHFSPHQNSGPRRWEGVPRSLIREAKSIRRHGRRGWGRSTVRGRGRTMSHGRGQGLETTTNGPSLQSSQIEKNGPPSCPLSQVEDELENIPPLPNVDSSTSQRQRGTVDRQNL